MFRSFDDITKDIGQELKNCARKTYATFSICAILLAGIIVFVSAVLSIDYGDFFIFLLGCVAALIAGLWLYAVGYIITINRYAKGESVHLLRSINGDPVPEEVITPSAAQPTSLGSALDKLTRTQPASRETPALQATGDWVCPSCKKKNTANATYCAGCYQVRPK